MTVQSPRLELTTEQLLQIETAARRLEDEFARTFSVDAIRWYLTDSQTKLEARAQFATWLPVLIERFTRDRLKALTRLEARPERPAVLFLCVHNPGRSQMASGWLRHLAGDTVDVLSGGSDPARGINATAVAAMAEVGIDIASAFPTPWTEEIARAADVIVTMGGGDACPLYPGNRYEDWELTDPAGQPVEVVRTIRDNIEQRVRELLASLDVPARM
jgi:protein-tyrosine-phosphatase